MKAMEVCIKLVFISLFVLLSNNVGALRFVNIDWSPFINRVHQLQANCVRSDCASYLLNKTVCMATTSASVGQLISIILKSFSDCHSQYMVCGQCFNYIPLLNKGSSKRDCTSRGFCFDGPVHLAFVGRIALDHLTAVKITPVPNCDDIKVEFTAIFPRIVFIGDVKLNTKGVKKGLTKKTELIKNTQISLMDVKITMEITLSFIKSGNYEVARHRIIDGSIFTVKVGILENNQIKKQILVQLLDRKFTRLLKSQIFRRIVGLSLSLYVKQIISTYFNICMMLVTIAT